MAEALAQAGADLSICGTSDQKNAAAAEHLRAFGRRIIHYKCDVSKEGEVEELIDHTICVFGRIDACFVNAAVGPDPSIRAFAEISFEEWRRVMAINLDGAFFTLKAVTKPMMSLGGSLVVTSSLAAISGQARGQQYAASKGALIPMIRGLAVELARYKIRANAILPGFVDTHLAEPLIGNSKFVDRVLPRIPMRRWGKPQDFGGIAVYLASDASAYHTGDVILIDGGYAAF